VVNESLAFSLLGLASSGLATLLSIGLAVVGLAYVRRVNTMAGLCMAGAGLLGAMGSVIRRIVSFAMSFIGGMTLLTISQIFTTLLSLLASALIPLAIFLLANAVKQGTRQAP
jgi:hypothetical protein